MNCSVQRSNNRACNQLRTTKVTYNLFGYAPGNVLFELGNTKVLCSVSMQKGVPPFLKGTKSGWLTAEYALLPSATAVRTQRESVQQRRNGRTVAPGGNSNFRQVTNIAVFRLPDKFYGSGNIEFKPF